jgi:hypothetical protein
MMLLLLLRLLLLKMSCGYTAFAEMVSRHLVVYDRVNRIARGSYTVKLCNLFPQSTQSLLSESSSTVFKLVNSE